MLLGPLPCRPLLTLSVKMTPNFQIWYLTSMDMSLEWGERDGRVHGAMLKVEGPPLATPPPAPGLSRVHTAHQVSSPGGGSGLRSL